MGRLIDFEGIVKGLRKCQKDDLFYNELFPTKQIGYCKIKYDLFAHLQLQFVDIYRVFSPPEKGLEEASGFPATAPFLRQEKNTSQKLHLQKPISHSREIS